MAEQARIKIKELVAKSGVTRATIYHYVREGILPQPVKTARNMALYDPDCIERILLVKGLQKHHRRSLAEVKTMLEGAPGHQGIERLRQVLESEATRAQSSPLRADRPNEPIGRKALKERTGFSSEEIDEMERLGILTAHKRKGAKAYDPINVDVADALSGLAKAGFDKESGFEAKHAVIYLDALRNLMQEEVSLFLEKVQGNSDPVAMLSRAEQGIEKVTPLLLALRRKLLKELIDAMSLPGVEDK